MFISFFLQFPRGGLNSWFSTKYYSFITLHHWLLVIFCTTLYLLCYFIYFFQIAYFHVYLVLHDFDLVSPQYTISLNVFMIIFTLFLNRALFYVICSSVNKFLYVPYKVCFLFCVCILFSSHFHEIKDSLNFIIFIYFFDVITPTFTCWFNYGMCIQLTLYTTLLNVLSFN